MSKIDIQGSLPESLKEFYAGHKDHGRFGIIFAGRRRGFFGDPIKLGCSNCAVGPHPVTTSETILPDEDLVIVAKNLQEVW